MKRIRVIRLMDDLLELEKQVIEDFQNGLLTKQKTEKELKEIHQELAKLAKVVTGNPAHTTPAVTGETRRGKKERENYEIFLTW